MNKNLLDLTSEEIYSQIISEENLSGVKYVMEKLSPDPVYGETLLKLLEEKKIETRSVVAWIANQIIPSTYLEVGVRRGWSTAQVVSCASEVRICAFDEWHENYASSPNPGPKFVQAEMKKIGYGKKINFYNGNSHETLPKFFETNPDIKLDLVLIDGDHSIDGALQDLRDVMPYIRSGGALVFDDLIDCELDRVWDFIPSEFDDFVYHRFMQNSPGVGLAIRK